MKRKSHLMATDRQALDPEQTPTNKVQGEGDYEAARRFRKSSEEFVKTHDVEAEARRVAPKNEREAQELRHAEAEGRARAKTSAAKERKGVSSLLEDDER